MRPRPDCSEIIPWLNQTAEDLCREFFDDMPPVTFVCANQKDCIGIEARYLAGGRVIEFSPGFIVSCWKGKRYFWDLGRLRVTLVHELIHAWVHWRGLWSDFAGGHNEWFLYKAGKVGADLNATRFRWSEVVPLHDDIRLGWEPGVMGLPDWRTLVGASKGWGRMDWGSLVASCRVIAEAESRVSASDWRRTVAALKRCNPTVSDYEFVLEIEERVPSYECRENRWAPSSWFTTGHESAVELKCLHPHQWHEIIERCRGAFRIIEQWDGESIYQIGEEYRHVRHTLNECAEAIKCCKPMRDFFARLRAGFDREIAHADAFGSELERNCYDEGQAALYSEVNHLCFRKPDTDIYQFFRRIFPF